MKLVDRLSGETAEFHAEADADMLQLLGPVTLPQYRRFLVRLYGFVVPLERSLAAVRGLDRLLDPGRLRKSELLRTDLLALHFTTDVLDRLPRCSVPPIDTIEEALGWAYPIERGALGNANVYRHLATKMPGEIAFSAAYLKCYAGVVGESWKSYSDAVEQAATSELAATRLIDAARASFRAWRTGPTAEEPASQLTRPRA